MLHNHKWEKQQTLVTERFKTQKGSGRQRYPPKAILRWVKRTVSNVNGRQKTTTKFKLQKQLKNSVHLIKKMN